MIGGIPAALDAVMVLLGIDEPEERAGIWEGLGPLPIATDAYECIDQIHAVREGRGYQYAPPPVSEPVVKTGDDDLDELIFAAPSGEGIFRVCDEVMKTLLKKNIAYGNSALDPARVFSTASAEEQLLVRVDDKLNRIANGQGFPGDDDVLDLVGYLILLRVARQA